MGRGGGFCDSPQCSLLFPRRKLLTAPIFIYSNIRDYYRDLPTKTLEILEVGCFVFEITLMEFSETRKF